MFCVLPEDYLCSCREGINTNLVGFVVVLLYGRKKKKQQKLKEKKKKKVCPHETILDTASDLVNVETSMRQSTDIVPVELEGV